MTERLPFHADSQMISCTHTAKAQDYNIEDDRSTNSSRERVGKQRDCPPGLATRLKASTALQLRFFQEDLADGDLRFNSERSAETDNRVF